MDIVIIRWVDSSFQHGWRELSEIRETLAEIITVGLVAKREKDKIVVMQSYDQSTNNYADGMVIPKCCIKSIKIIGNTTGG